MARNIEGLKIANKNSTLEEQRERSRKAGIASGKARREKRSMKETLEFILDSEKIPTGNKAVQGMKNTMLAFGFREDDINMRALYGFSIIYNGLVGKSPKYIEMVLNLIGEMPTNKLELTGANGAPLTTPEITVNFPVTAGEKE